MAANIIPSAATTSATTSTSTSGTNSNADKKLKQKSIKNKNIPDLDPEEIERKRVERKAKKAAKAAQAAVSKPLEIKGFLPREWVSVNQKQQQQQCENSTRFFTWNMLAQALVRRDLFPGSDFLRFKDRGPSLDSQLLHYSPDIACLQEVDQLKDYLSILSNSDYSFVHETGYANKKHGLLVLWKNTMYKSIQKKLIKLDDLEFSPGRRAISRRTRNIALMVALQSNDNPDKGVIVATTHLFWHPRHCYERARQMALILHELGKFREQENVHHWPCVFAGDFNFQPNETTYGLVTGADLDVSQMQDIIKSAVIHETIDHEKEGDNQDEEEDDGEGEDGDASESQGKEQEEEQGDPDRVLNKCRPAKEKDGLLSMDELKSMFKSSPLKSLYAQHYRNAPNGQFYSNRPKTDEPAKNAHEPSHHEGKYEPMWTSFTPLWRCTLDYMFVIESEKFKIETHKLLSLHDQDKLEPGLPRYGIEPSDHVALGAEIEFLNR